MSYAFVHGGRIVNAQVPAMTPLVDVLRDVVGDSSPKPGCREGRCGACTVLLNDEPVLSCLVPVALCDGGPVETVRTLAGNDLMTLIQECFSATGAIQCGVCTPGMVTVGFTLLRENPEVDEEGIKEALVNNMCRCTGYRKIIDALLLAQQRLLHAEAADA